MGQGFEGAVALIAIFSSVFYNDEIVSQRVQDGEVRILIHQCESAEEIERLPPPCFLKVVI